MSEELPKKWTIQAKANKVLTLCWSQTKSPKVSQGRITWDIFYPISEGEPVFHPVFIPKQTTKPTSPGPATKVQGAEEGEGNYTPLICWIRFKAT